MFRFFLPHPPVSITRHRPRLPYRRRPSTPRSPALLLLHSPRASIYVGLWRFATGSSSQCRHMKDGHNTTHRNDRRRAYWLTIRLVAGRRLLESPLRNIMSVGVLNGGGGRLCGGDGFCVGDGFYGGAVLHGEGRLHGGGGLHGNHR